MWTQGLSRVFVEKLSIQDFCTGKKSKQARKTYKKALY